MQGGRGEAQGHMGLVTAASMHFNSVNLTRADPPFAIPPPHTSGFLPTAPPPLIPGPAALPGLMQGAAAQWIARRPLLRGTETVHMLCLDTSMAAATATATATAFAPAS